jgi:hypothetical protein
MNKITAENMIKALKPYKQYLLINEWNNIVGVIEHWIEYPKEHKDKKITFKKTINKKEVPPLKAFWNTIWSKNVSVPIGVLILIGVGGIMIGKYIL